MPAVLRRGGLTVVSGWAGDRPFAPLTRRGLGGRPGTRVRFLRPAFPLRRPLLVLPLALFLTSGAALLVAGLLGVMVRGVGEGSTVRGVRNGGRSS